jgi:hypothetical protein
MHRSPALAKTKQGVSCIICHPSRHGFICPLRDPKRKWRRGKYRGDERIIIRREKRGRAWSNGVFLKRCLFRRLCRGMAHCGLLDQVFAAFIVPPNPMCVSMTSRKKRRRRVIVIVVLASPGVGSAYSCVLVHALVVTSCSRVRHLKRSQSVLRSSHPKHASKQVSLVHAYATYTHNIIILSTHAQGFLLVIVPWAGEEEE